MKAKAICPKCGKKLETTCKRCIDVGTDVHICKGKKEMDVVENVKWKIIKK
jgi:hypothetical protein